MPPRQDQAKSAVAPRPAQADNAFRITTTNENWRGKNDPAERRRIQNRLNQRAFRERQRAGEATKQCSPRGDSTGSRLPENKPTSDGEDDDEKDKDDEDDEESDSKEDDSTDDEGDDDQDDNEDVAEQSNPGSPPPSATQPQITSQVSRAACSPSSPSTDNPWDELAQLINRNFMQAVTANAQRLSLNLVTLRAGTTASTPRPRNATNLPASLKPIEVQHQLPHDPIIDTIPHPRLRFNILRAIATGNLDAARFSACLRRSGAVVNVQGEPRRSGLVVWNHPDQLASWELSEAFVLLWGFLLEGCEDFVSATNVWRNRRGENSLVVSLKSGGR